jgi:hypothetical protein
MKMENKAKKALNLIVVVEEIFNENKTASIRFSGIVDANEKQKKGKVVSVVSNVPNIQMKYTLNI